MPTWPRLKAAPASFGTLTDLHPDQDLAATLQQAVQAAKAQLRGALAEQLQAALDPGG